MAGSADFGAQSTAVINEQDPRRFKALSKEDKTRLTEHWEDILKDITCVDDILDALYAKKAILDDPKEKIKSRDTEKDRARELLRYITKSNQFTYEVFVEKLGICQPHIAVYLRPTEYGVEGLLPAVKKLSVGGEENRDRKEDEIKWKISPPTGCLRQGTFAEGSGVEETCAPVYPMNKSKKGKVCIIAVHEFARDEDNLPGYKEDTKRLEAMWNKFGFNVYIPPCADGRDGWYTATDIMTAVESFATLLTDDDMCVVLHISSHGDENGIIYGSDNSVESTATVLEKFNNENCPKMIGKPKVLFIQACQGGKHDSGVKPAGVKSSLAIWPTFSDTIVCTPSFQGYVSWVGGMSIYFKSVVDVFNDYAHTDDIHKLLTRVNDDVANQDIDGTQKQMPEFRSTLRKQLYFL